ncbi:hypothetical protein PQI66_08080 [Corynebacterium sp. USCH3]|uniref:hypothetical protein n=1 Tax=Corynebacterium sp. USCH3 TaxID=3024840 RepID=UPI0030B26E15
MTSHPHAKERGSWVLSHAGRRPGARRRGERLMLAARRDRRDRAGVGAAGVTEVVTPSVLYRVTHRGGEAGGGTLQGVLGLLGLTVMLAFTWPALLLGWAVYGAWVLLHSKVRPSPWAPAVLAAVLFVAAWFWWSNTNHPTPGVRLQAQWWAIQPALGLTFTAWLTRAYGWPGVPRNSSGSGMTGLLDSAVTEGKDEATPPASEDTEVISEANGPTFDDLMDDDEDEPDLSDLELDELINADENEEASNGNE